MAKINEISAMAALGFAIGLVLLSPGLAGEDDPALSPSYLKSDWETFDPDLPPEISNSPGDYKFLNECAKKLNTECAEDIFSGVFKDAVVLTKPCCSELMEMGKKCLDAMVKTMITIPDFKPEAYTALSKTDQIWMKCFSHGV